MNKICVALAVVREFLESARSCLTIEHNFLGQVRGSGTTCTIVENVQVLIIPILTRNWTKKQKKVKINL